MTDTSNARAKVDRAHEHIECLARMVDAFRVQAYTVDAQPDMWTEPTPPAKGHVIVFADATSEPPSLVWGPIIGDIVHGLRSALDQLAWTLTIEFQATQGSAPPPDPIPYGNPWRNIWFPVSLDEGAWANAVQKQLWGIDPALHAPLKALQPLTTGQNAPEREPLAVLGELWNIDKHRHLHLVNSTIELHDVLTTEPFPDFPTELNFAGFEVISKRPAGPLIGRTEIGRVKPITKPGGIIAVSLPQMHMNPRLAIDVAFEQGPPAHGGRVLETLRDIEKTVRAIVAAV